MKAIYFVNSSYRQLTFYHPNVHYWPEMKLEIHAGEKKKRSDEKKIDAFCCDFSRYVELKILIFRYIHIIFYERSRLLFFFSYLSISLEPKIMKGIFSFSIVRCSIRRFISFVGAIFFFLYFAPHTSLGLEGQKKKKKMYKSFSIFEKT